MLAVELAKYLDALGLVKYDEAGSTGDVYIGQLPSVPDNLVAIYPTGGPGSDQKLGYDSPSVQVIVRNVNIVSADSKAREIYDALHGISSISLPDGTWTVSCHGIQSGPVYIGQDKNDRHEFSLNFMLEVRNKNANRE